MLFFKLHVSIANGEDPDHTVSSEAVWSGSVLFVKLHVRIANREDPDCTTSSEAN